MVKGIESFKEKFKDFPDCYTIIGGAACDILMTEANVDFRATRDIDMILIFEDKYQEFAKTFWNYIKEGGYKCGWKNSEKMHFYRFTEPKPGYPSMIELFSRNPGYHLEVSEGIVPIHIDDDTSSLSAILLNDDFYSFMIEGKKTVSGVSVLRAEYLIPFKMFAWLNLKEQKEAGKHVNERDLRKHKYDVFRLLQIIPNDVEIESHGLVNESIVKFLNQVKNEDMNLEQVGLNYTIEEGIELLKDIYLLT